MLRLLKAFLLATVVVIGATGHNAYGLAIPLTLDIAVPYKQFNVTKHQVGADNNVRFLWDYVTAAGYNGSVLWILNPQGQLVATGDTQIPASIGTGISPLGLALSNTAINVAGSGNVTVVFAHVITPATTSTPAVVDSFSTWTYNAQGTLIAFGGPYGPFGNALLENLEFKNGTLIAQWANQGLALGTVSVWSLDEFGKIQTAAGPFGPFGTLTELVGVDVSKINGNPVQIWHWLFVNGTGAGQAAGDKVWTIDQTGNIIASASYGPF
jgi:hypothetical protein